MGDGLLRNFTSLSWERKKPPPEWHPIVKTHSSKRTSYEAHPYRPLGPGRVLPAPPFRPLSSARAEPPFPGPHPRRLQPQESRLIPRSPGLSNPRFARIFLYLLLPSSRNERKIRGGEPHGGERPAMDGGAGRHARDGLMLRKRLLIPEKKRADQRSAQTLGGFST